MFFYIVLAPITTTSGLWSAGNTRKYQQIDEYIYQCVTSVKAMKQKIGTVSLAKYLVLIKAAMRPI